MGNCHGLLVAKENGVWYANKKVFGSIFTN